MTLDQLFGPRIPPFAQLSPALQTEYGTEAAYLDYWKPEGFMYQKTVKNNEAMTAVVAALAVVVLADGWYKLLAIPIWFLTPKSSM